MTESKTIIQMEKELAKAKAEEAKKAGFEVVVNNAETNELAVIKARAQDLTESDKATIMEASGKLGEEFEALEKAANKLDKTVGSWLKIMTILEEPIQTIVSTMFKIDKEEVAVLPNLELLGYIFGDNPWIDKNAGKLAKELEFLAEKNK